MKDKFDKFMHSKVFIIILILVFIILSGVLGTYAWFTWSNPSDSNTKFTMTIGDVGDVRFEDGNSITGNLEPVYNYYDGLSTSFDVYSKMNYTKVKLHIYFNLTSPDFSFVSEDIRYVVVSNDNVLNEGTFAEVSENKLLLYSGILLSKESTYQIYFYIDGNKENNPDMMNKTISGNINVTAEIGDDISAAGYITNLYTSNNPTEIVQYQNDGETEQARYYYSYMDEDNTWGLMNDGLGNTVTDTNALINGTEGNIRYYGANPNNYVDLGDTEIKDGKEVTTLYRIIGVFKDIELSDGTKKDLIKVIRDESIGDYSWDNKTSGIGSSISDYGSNDWTESRLMMMLNPEYDKYNTTNPFLDASGDTIYGYEGSLWWNSKSGTCYSGFSNGANTCDFTSTGLSSDAHNKIEEVVWNLGGNSTLSAYSDVMYTAERGTTVYTGRPTEWTGKVALTYSSDYGYATDLSKCDKNLYSYDSSDNSYACRSNDWLFNNNYQWQLTPFSSYSYVARGVYSAGSVSNYGVYAAYGVRPVFYLNSELVIESGEGTIEEPYVLG